MAQERIEAVSGDVNDPRPIQIGEPLPRPRITFGAILEQGLIKPGQELTYKDGSILVLRDFGRAASMQLGI